MIERIAITDREQWPVCDIPGCKKPRRRKRAPFCGAHYSRLLKHGDPLITVNAPPSERRQFIDRAIGYSGDECLYWPFGKSGNGYGEIQIGGKRVAVHALVCARLHGPAPTSEHQVAHSCGRGHLGCVNPSHLRWATSLENAGDKILHGTSGVGSLNPRAILHETDIPAIRSDPRRASIIAREYGVSRNRIWAIKTNREWCHVD